jgi:hypothetical protein
VVREQLERYAGGDTVTAAMREFLEIAERSQARSGPEGRGWSRESLYDR